MPTRGSKSRLHSSSNCATDTSHTSVLLGRVGERERERENVCAFLDLLFSLPFEFMIKSLLREKEVKGKERKGKEWKVGLGDTRKERERGAIVA